MWQDILISVIGTAVSTAIVVAIKYLIAYLSSKTNSEEAKKILAEIDEVVTNNVLATNQTIVSNIKGTEAWTPEKQKEILLGCLENIALQLSQKAVDYIETNHGSIEDYLTTRIEAAVLANK
jgi:hypothetical protein